MPTAQDLIKGALRRINSYQSGEALAQPDAQDCLDTLNDLLDSWSIQKDYVYGSVENILTLQSGKAQYRVGNPSNASLGFANATGNLFSGSSLIGAATIPSQMIVGGTLSDGAGLITSGTTVSSITNGTTAAITFSAPPSGTTGNLVGWAGGAVTGQFTFSDGNIRMGTITVGGVSTWTGGLVAGPTTAASINTNIITMSANATGSTTLDVIGYTIPGDFAISRPNRITNAFTRFSQLDYTIEVTMSQARFTEILYKAQPGPWPTVAWYNPQNPYGLLNFYQTPGNNGELHLFTDTILSNLTLNQTFVLPSGYTRAIKWCLAKEICAEYGFPLTDSIKVNAAESLAAIKALNAVPAEVARYDSMLLSNKPNASWIMNGGYG